MCGGLWSGIAWKSCGSGGWLLMGVVSEGGLEKVYILDERRRMYVGSEIESS